MNMEQLHNQRITHLELKPRLFGLEDVVVSAKEVKFRDLTGRIVAEPDIMFVDKQGNVSVVEYKVHDKSFRKAKNQLRTAYDFLNTFYGIRPDLYYATEQYAIEKVAL